MQRLFAIFAFALCASATTAAHASRPVKTSLDGCVVDRTFYDVGEHVFAITMPDDVDLAALEGKHVAMTGWISVVGPFQLAEGTAPEVRATRCPAPLLLRIRHEQAHDLAIAAWELQRAGDLEGAERGYATAFAKSAPVDCDLYSMRALVLVKLGDVVAAKRDLATVRAQQCYSHDGPNDYLVADVAEALLARGDRRGAADATRTAFELCDDAECRMRYRDRLATLRR
jgi:hypothetical protein